MVRCGVLQRKMLESLFPFENWTKKMSKNEKGKYFCANSVTSQHFLPRFLWF
jgi:hypothetical protein